MTEHKIREAVEGYAARTGRIPTDIKAALIDMDGTLYDSMRLHARAWHRMVSELGIESVEDEFYAYEGMTGKATINLLMKKAGRPEVGDEKAAELYARKAAYFRTEGLADVMPGAQKMVDIFKTHGVTTILVTGSAQSSMLSRIENDFPGSFPENRRITAKDVTQCKPAPEPYLKGLAIGGVTAGQAVVVENAPLGVEAGHNAGIFTIGVRTGPLPAESLARAGADIVFNSMTECADSLCQLLFYMNTYRKCNI